MNCWFSRIRKTSRADKFWVFALIDIGKWPQGNCATRFNPLWKRKKFGSSVHARITKCWMIKEPPGSCGFFVHGNLAFKETRNKHRDFTQNCQKVFNCSILGMSLGVICSVCSPLNVETNYVYNVRLACLELYIEICMSQFSQACTFGTRSGLDQRWMYCSYQRREWV